jgi:hypothetical protein
VEGETMKLTVDGIELEVSDEVGAVIQAMLRRSDRRADSITEADLARARFDAETLSAHKWGAGAGAPALPLNADGEVDLDAARQRFDAASRDAWRWGTLTRT